MVAVTLVMFFIFAFQGRIYKDKINAIISWSMSYKDKVFKNQIQPFEVI